MVRLAGVGEDCDGERKFAESEGGCFAVVGGVDGIFVAHGANRGTRPPQWIKAVEDGGIYYRLRRFANFLWILLTSRDVGYKYTTVFDGLWKII